MIGGYRNAIKNKFAKTQWSRFITRAKKSETAGGESIPYPVPIRSGRQSFRHSSPMYVRSYDSLISQALLVLLHSSA